MKKIVATIITIAALVLVLAGSACVGEGAVAADSTMQKAMKIVPSEWNMFYYLDAKEMRADVAVPEGLNAIWDVAEDYLDEFVEAMELDPANWPLPVDKIDYLGIAIGGGSSTAQEYVPMSTVFIISGSFSLTAVSNYLDDFDTNYPDAGASFTAGTYNGVETWTPDTVQNYEWQEDPDVLIALTTGSSIALVGDEVGVKACIDVIKTAGDEDSMLGDEGVGDILANLADPVFGGIMSQNQEMPESGYEGDPDYPDQIDVTMGFSLSRVGDKLRMECIAEMDAWGDWQEFILNEMPEEGYLPYPFSGGSRYISRGVDEARKTEKTSVMTSIAALMADSNIGGIPNPVTYPTDDMSAFPDNTSDDTATGIGGKDNDPAGDPYDFTLVTDDKPGYVLWDHDNTAEGDQTRLERYVSSRYTSYYYTINEDATLHQWSGPGGVEYID